MITVETDDRPSLFFIYRPFFYIITAIFLLADVRPSVSTGIIPRTYGYGGTVVRFYKKNFFFVVDIKKIVFLHARLRTAP